ncbi:MAG: hypothetical protein NVSMB19_13620 [Vulcanimicrobiaceae bacterium]
MSPLLVRATGIVCRPRATWRRVATESTSPFALFAAYVVPLASIGPLATYVALRETGVRIARGETFHASVGFAVAEALSSFGFALAGVLLVALIVAVLAPYFGVARSFSRSFRVASYAFTPVWLAGVTLFAPQLALLVVVAALYAALLLALGLEIVLGASRSRAALFAAVVIASALASGFAFGAVSAVVRGIAHVPSP